MLPKVAFGRRRALTCPTVKVWLIPNGAPTTKISSPTSTLSESPSVAGCTPAGTRSNCSNARSAAGSEARMLALMSVAARELDRHGIRGLHDVRGGEHFAIRTDEHTRPQSWARTSQAQSSAARRALARSYVPTTTAPPTCLKVCDSDGAALAASAGALRSMRRQDA